MLSPGTESSFAQPINKNDLTEIQRKMEVVNKKKSSLSLPVKYLGRTFKKGAGSGLTNPTTFSAVKLYKGLSQDVVNATYSSTWIQWQFSG